MGKFKKLTLSALFMTAFLAGGGVMKIVSAETNYDSLRKFSQILDIVQQYYVKDVPQKELLDGALKGMLQNLDPHSTLMSKKEFQEMQESTSGEFSGVGVEITMENGNVLVVSPIEDTPGYKAGIRSGDLILAVDGQATMGMSLSEVSSKMRGKRGVAVELKVLHKNQTQPITMKIVRDNIPLISVKAKELEPGYHWIRLTRFSSKTTEEMKQALNKAKQKGALKGIVLDVRNNPGGLLDQSVKIADLFLKEGKVVSMRGRDKASENAFYATTTPDDITCPLVVLVNAGSASAAEIVSGALQDQKRAVLIGERTFGKGSVQNLIPLSDGTGLKLTVARYYTPSGKSIQAEGIKPDFEIAWEEPRENKKGPSFSLREQDLYGHLEQKQEQVKKEDPKKGKLKKDDKKKDVSEKEEVADMLKKDNQLRMAFQFVKALPAVKNLK